MNSESTVDIRHVHIVDAAGNGFAKNPFSSVFKAHIILSFIEWPVLNAVPPEGSYV